MKEYKSNPAFVKDRTALREQYAGVIKEVAMGFSEWWSKELPSLNEESLANELDTFENLKSRVKNFSELGTYIDGLKALCQKHYLHYPWGPMALFCMDIYEALQLNQGQKLLFVSDALGLIMGLPAYIMLPLPTVYFCLGTRKEIRKYIDSQLNKISKPSDWKDIPHALERHVKWFYANKVLGKSPKQIAEIESFDESKVREAIRTVNRLLGGKPRARGRPPKNKNIQKSP